MRKRLAKRAKAIKPIWVDINSRNIPARPQVFAIPDLRILILRELPMRDLLFVQVVCPTWHATIRDTVELQRLLFFRRAACGPLPYCDWRVEDIGLYRAALGANLFGTPLRGAQGAGRPKRYAAHWGASRHDGGAYRMWANPLLAKAVPFLRGDGVFAGDTLEDLGAEWMYNRASWRRMLVTQPECARCWCWGRGWGAWGHVDDVVYSWQREGREDLEFTLFVQEGGVD